MKKFVLVFCLLFSLNNLAFLISVDSGIIDNSNSNDDSDFQDDSVTQSSPFIKKSNLANLSQSKNVLLQKSDNEQKSSKIDIDLSISSMQTFKSAMEKIKISSIRSNGALFEFAKLKEAKMQKISLGSSLKSLENQSEILEKKIANQSFVDFMHAMNLNDSQVDFLDGFKLLIQSYDDVLSLAKENGQKNLKEFQCSMFRENSVAIKFLILCKNRLLQFCKLKISSINKDNYSDSINHDFFEKELLKFDNLFVSFETIMEEKLAELKKTGTMNDSEFNDCGSYFYAVSILYQQQRDEILLSGIYQLLKFLSLSKKTDLNSASVKKYFSYALSIINGISKSNLAISIDGMVEAQKIHDVISIFCSKILSSSIFAQKQKLDQMTNLESICDALEVLQKNYADVINYAIQGQNQDLSNSYISDYQNLKSLSKLINQAFENEKSKHYDIAFTSYKDAKNLCDKLTFQKLSALLSKNEYINALEFQKQQTELYAKNYNKLIIKYYDYAIKLPINDSIESLEQELFVKIFFQTDSAFFKGFSFLSDNAIDIYREIIYAYCNEDKQIGLVLSKAFDAFDDLSEVSKMMLLDAKDVQSADSLNALGTIEGLEKSLKKYESIMFKIQSIDDQFLTNEYSDLKYLFSPNDLQKTFSIKNFEQFFTLHFARILLTNGLRLFNESLLQKDESKVFQSVASVYFLYSSYFYKKLGIENMYQYCQKKIEAYKDSQSILLSYANFFLEKTDLDEAFFCANSSAILENDHSYLFLISLCEKLNKNLKSKDVNSLSDYFFKMADIYFLSLKYTKNFDQNIKRAISYVLDFIKQKSLVDGISDDDVIKNQNDLKLFVNLLKENFNHQTIQSACCKAEIFQLISIKEDDLGNLILNCFDGQKLIIKNPDFILAKYVEKKTNSEFEKIKDAFLKFDFSKDISSNSKDALNQLKKSLKYYIKSGKTIDFSRAQKLYTDIVAFNLYSKILPICKIIKDEAKKLEIDYLISNYEINLSDFYDGAKIFIKDLDPVLNAKKLIEKKDDQLIDVIVQWYKIYLLSGGYKDSITSIEKEIENFSSKLIFMTKAGIDINGFSLKSSFELKEVDSELILICKNLPIVAISRFSNESLSAVSYFEVSKKLYSKDPTAILIEGQKITPVFMQERLNMIDGSLLEAYKIKIESYKKVISLIISQKEIFELINMHDELKKDLKFSTYKKSFDQIIDAYSWIFALYEYMKDLGINVDQNLVNSYQDCANYIALFLVDNPICQDYTCNLQLAKQYFIGSLSYKDDKKNVHQKIAKLYEISAKRAESYPYSTLKFDNFPEFKDQDMFTFENAAIFYQMAIESYDKIDDQNSIKKIKFQKIIALTKAATCRLSVFAKNVIDRSRLLNVDMDVDKRCLFKLKEPLSLKDKFLKIIKDNASLSYGKNKITAQKQYSIMQSLLLDAITYFVSASEESGKLDYSFDCKKDFQSSEFGNSFGKNISDILTDYYGATKSIKDNSMPVTFLSSIEFGKPCTTCNLPKILCDVADSILKNGLKDKKQSSSDAIDQASFFYKQIGLTTLNEYYQIFIMQSDDYKKFVLSGIEKFIGTLGSNFLISSQQYNVLELQSFLSQLHFMSRTLYGVIYSFGENQETQIADLNSQLSAKQQSMMCPASSYVG